eukprot:60881_1
MSHIIVDISLVLMTLNVLTHCQNCVYPDLNISGLDGLNIQCVFEYDATYVLQYTPCQSNLQCSIFDLDTYMVLQNSLSGNCAAGVAKYDANVLPEKITVHDTKAYRFSYANGASSFQCGTGRQLNLTFICDPNADPYDPNALKCGTGENTTQCEYYLEIPTIYACNNKPPEDECIWSDGDNTLNLTIIQGFVLNKISDNDPSQIYSISPCSNNLNCHDEMSMMTVGTISTCIQTIARWDQGETAPAYSSNFGGQWQFIYINGDSCNNGPQSVVNVFWNCNPFAGNARIMAARETGMCNFEIQID